MHPPDGESSGSEEEYQPCRSNSSAESDSSSDGNKKPRALPTTTNQSKPIKKEKCQGKACPGLPPSNHTPMFKCGLDECPKFVHRICYEKQLDKSTKARNPIEELVFCNLGHHDKFVKSHSDIELTWTNDGQDGPDDPRTSQFYLVEWLSTEVNYQRFRDPPGALTKMKVCEEIASMLSMKETRNKWKGENVYNKIQHIEQKMKSCHDGFAGTKTGHGLKETDPLGYEDKVSYVDTYVATVSTKHIPYLFLSRSVEFALIILIWRMYSAHGQAWFRGHVLINCSGIMSPPHLSVQKSRRLEKSFLGWRVGRGRMILRLHNVHVAVQ
jgi:hypothetical protein